MIIKISKSQLINILNEEENSLSPEDKFSLLDAGLESLASNSDDPAIAALGDMIISRQLGMGDVNDEDYIEGRITLSTSYNKKINPKLTLKTGVYVNNLLYDLYHDKLINEMTVNYLDIKDNSFLIQPYVNFRIRPRVDWLINIGTHAMYFNLNNTYSVEPRLAVRKTFSKNNSLSFAYGLHSRTLPTGSYFTRLTDDQGIVTNPNIDLELIKSHHLVIAYDQLIANRLRLHTEVYFQYLYDVPVSIDENSSYSILNEIDGFATQALVSQGTGRNYGIDISLQQSFDAGFFMLLSTSIFESTYQPINKGCFKVFQHCFEGIPT